MSATKGSGPSVAAVALAVLLLAVLRQPSYDPTAWLIWGRELTHGTLSMVGGPSWKPLPVAFTTVFGLAGSDAAPLLWLTLARAGGFLAIVLIYRVTARLGGRTAGLIAAAGLALGTDYLFNVVRGDSEGILVALCLLALDLHLSGRRRAALTAGLVAGLVRPEVWPLLAVYGLGMLRERHGRAASAGWSSPAAWRCWWRGSCPTTWRRGTGCAAPTARAIPSPAPRRSRASPSG